MGSYGSLVSDYKTQERFHLGVKDLKVGLANSLCLMISDRFSSDPMTLPLPPPYSVDLFASRLNNKLPLYVSLVPDSQAMTQDALSLKWQYLDAYAFPHSIYRMWSSGN